MSENTRNTDN